MEDATVAEYQLHWQRAAQQHRRAIWSLIVAGELLEVTMEAAKSDLLRLGAGAARAIAVADGDLQQRIIHLQGNLAGAESEYRRIIRATYAHLLALRVLRRQLQFRA